MKLVVDANIMFSYFREDTLTYTLLNNENLELFAPALLQTELREHQKEICAKSKITEDHFHSTMKRLQNHITFVDDVAYLPELERARGFSPDPKDTEYLALALYLSCPLWTRDKRLQQQDTVLIVPTEDVATSLQVI